MTGGAGYVGSEVCAQAIARGWDVVATQHRTPAPHGRGVTLDVRDDAAVHRAFVRYGPDAVIHTAYVLSGPAMSDTILHGTHAVAEASARAGARLVHLSTDLVFDGEHGAPYAEDAEPRPVSAYGAAKAEAERLVGDALIVRTSVQYGKPEPGQQELLAFRDDVEFFTDEIRCPCLVAETVAALLDLVGLDVVGPLHVAPPEAVARDELARLLRAAHGRDPSTVRGAPTPPGRARNVALDSAKAAGILGRSLTGVHAAIGRSA